MQKHPAELKARARRFARQTMAADPPVSRWKKKAQEALVDVFSDHQQRRSRRRFSVRKVGVEKDFLSKAFGVHGRMDDSNHSELASRGVAWVDLALAFYYDGLGESELTLELMRRIDEQFLETPFYGSRQMARCAGRASPQSEAGARRERWASRRCASARRAPHRVSICCATDGRTCDEAWCADVTPAPRLPPGRDPPQVVARDGYLVLCGGRKPSRYGPPADQGSRSPAWSRRSKTQACRSRWTARAAGWRLHRAAVGSQRRLPDFEVGSEARASIGRWIDFYNAERPVAR